MYDSDPHPKERRRKEGGKEEVLWRIFMEKETE